MAICAPIIGLWYWCTDQYIVQRALGAPNEQIARRGSIFAAFLKLFPVYLFIIPGLICFALAKSGKVPGLGRQLIDARRQADSREAQAAFPLMVKYLLPAGLRGIVVAGLLSALMGSLAGVFNACSTLFTVDLYEKWKPKATQHQIVRTGRIATAVMVLIALAWIPVVKGADSLYEYLQGQGYLAPPIFVVFFFGVFFKRLNAKGCLWAMVVGFVLGLFRMVVDTPVTLGLRSSRLDSRTCTPGLVPLDRQQHQLPVLQRADHARLGRGDGRGELPDAAAGLRADREPDLRHGHGRRPPPHPRKLGLARRAGLGRGPGVHPRGLPVFPRIAEHRNSRGLTAPGTCVDWRSPSGGC